MIVFFYEKVRLKRGVWQTVSIVLLIAFLCAFFTLFDGFICQKEQDMAKLRGRDVGVPYLPTLPTPEGAVKEGFRRTMAAAGLL